MKLKIEIPYNTFAVLPATNEVGALLAGLAQAILVSEAGYGKDKMFTVSDDKIKIELLDDNFNATQTDPFKKLQDELTASQTYGHKLYNRAAVAEKELKELKAKLASVSEAATSATNSTPPPSPSQEIPF